MRPIKAASSLFHSCPVRCRCEADPIALSKYVLALVEKDREVAELRKLCADQLEVFLGQG